MTLTDLYVALEVIVIPIIIEMTQLIIKTIKMNEFLHGYLFHYNPYTKLWAGFPRELMVDYFNGSENKKIIKMKSAEDLIEYLKE